MHNMSRLRNCLVFISIVFHCVQSQNEIPNLKYGYPPMNVETDSVQTSTISVRIDHFSFLGRSEFNLRYAYNDEFYNASANGPMLVLLSGESPLEVTKNYLKAGLMYNMAKNMGAYMFALEHRYYGNSVPNLNLQTNNLRQLTIKQAMADISDFINNRQDSISTLGSAKVVLFGGSYGGNLATWMRLKYPGVVDAAVSSSAPVQAKVNFLEYLEGMQTSYNNTYCMHVIGNATEAIQKKITTNSGLTEVQNDFSLCSPLQFNNKQEVRNLFWNIALPFMTAVQYGSRSSINAVCDDLVSNATSDTPYQKVAKFVTNSLQSTTDKCLISYATTIGILRTTDPNIISRSWFYENCKQLGYFTSTDSKNQPFQSTIPLNFFKTMCSDVFGMSLTNLGVTFTNNMYGAEYPAAQYVVSTQGSLDPWAALGINHDLSQFMPFIRINEASHCQDLLAETANDTQSLKNARVKIQNYISNWIS